MWRLGQNKAMWLSNKACLLCLKRRGATRPNRVKRRVCVRSQWRWKGGCDELVDPFFDSLGSAFDKLDIEVNAPGTFGVHVTMNPRGALWNSVLGVNLTGPYRTIKCCLPTTIERGWGRIVNIVSTRTNRGADDQGTYCASKAGLLELTCCVGRRTPWCYL